MMNKELKDKNLIGKISVIKNPELLKVLTIKKKHVDDMEQFSDDDLWPLEYSIVGRYLHLVIFRKDCENGAFFKAHEMNYARKLADNNYDMTSIYLQFIQDTLPQIFTD